MHCHGDQQLPQQRSLTAALYTSTTLHPFNYYYQGCSGAGTQWNAFPANILKPERRSGNYHWPQVER